MKKFHLFLVFTLLVGLVIYSCSKDESQIPDDSRLSLNEIKAVGEEHNHYILEGFQNFDFLARDKEQALTMSFLEFSPDLRSDELSLILKLGEKGFDPKSNGRCCMNRIEGSK